LIYGKFKYIAPKGPYQVGFSSYKVKRRGTILSVYYPAEPYDESLETDYP